jgi:hypothetical protein
VAFGEHYEDEQQGRAAAVELLSHADERVDLYGMNEREADLYLSTHYSQVVAHDTLRLSVLAALIKQGARRKFPAAMSGSLTTMPSRYCRRWRVGAA